MEESFVDIGGINTHFLRAGKGEKKLIILHGWDQNINVIDSYEALFQELNELGFLDDHEIIMPHMPGFGPSDMPDYEGWDTNDYADWLKQFLDTVIGDTKNVGFFTHSFGGRVLVRFLINNPNYTNRVIMASAAGIKWPPSMRQKVSIFLAKNFSRAKHILPQKIQKAIMNRIFGARDWGMVKEELKPTLKKVLEEEDFRDELTKIKTNILLLWGAQDKVTPLKSGRVFHVSLKRSKLIVFNDGKHGIHRTHSTEIAQQIDQFCQKKLGLSELLA